jgi:hypothetical protein
MVDTRDLKSLAKACRFESGRPYQFKGISMSLEIAIVVGYVVGSIVTGIMAYKRGVIRGSGATVDLLISANFVKWRKVNGEIELCPLDSKD